MEFYFSKFEHRKPPKPLPHSDTRELLWQCLAVMNLVFGAWYIQWRWTSSLNFDALWFSLPLVAAETCAYFGLILFTFNLWRCKDVEKQSPPASAFDIYRKDSLLEDRPISVDVFFPSYDEDPELVELSLIDAKKIEYPYDIDLKIHLLDDGNRPSMKALAEKHDVFYLSREDNVGFKAGNLRNALEKTHGDIVVICDADTRPFPSILENTLGYFKDPDVAWVQTPQWFYDIPDGRSITDVAQHHLGSVGRYLGTGLEALFGPIKIGQDPFCNDPKFFYDVIQRRRNWANASFCCGAGSLHRREAVMEAALRSYSFQIEKDEKNRTENVISLTGESAVDQNLSNIMKRQALSETEFTPYKFHVSEDIYTSIVLHSDQARNWKSVFHPDIESKMLSPQDLQTWAVQRFKYAGGTLDIFFHDNPLFRKGMSFKQKIMYSATFWSYFGGIWNLIFLLAPVVYLFTAIAPVNSYTMDFFIHIFPFLLFNELAFLVGTWGISTFKGKMSFLSFFSINLKAIKAVVMGEKIKFPTTPKHRQKGRFINIVQFHLVLLFATVSSLIFSGVSYFVLGNPLHHELSGIITNIFWCATNVCALSMMIFSAFWLPEELSLDSDQRDESLGAPLEKAA